MLRADSQVFFDLQGRPLVPDDALSDALNLGIVTVAPPLSSVARTDQVIECITASHAQMMSGRTRVRLITTASQLHADDDSVGIVAGLQRPPDDANLANLRRLMAAGVRIITVSYSHSGPFGGGYLHPGDPLTEMGRQLLRDCAKLGMIVGLSHASHQTARDVLSAVRLEELPLGILASHGGCSAVYNSPRNLPDDVLWRIAGLSGVVGIFNLTFGLHESDNGIGPVLDHLAHATHTCGVAHVCIGSDAAYRKLDVDVWQRHVEGFMQREVDPGGLIGSRWPDTTPELNGLDRLGALERAMYDDERFAPDEIDPVLGLNLGGFLARFLPLD
jgi:microsomal dipeptidase-like Zn-dependent dipeptidase